MDKTNRIRPLLWNIEVIDVRRCTIVDVDELTFALYGANIAINLCDLRN